MAVKMSAMVVSAAQRFLKHSILYQSARYLSATPAVFGVNEYTTPIRDIILENERSKEFLKVRRQVADLKDPDEGKVEIFFHNKNPRHLDLLGFNKPAGFTSLYENRNFYNKLHLEMTNRHTKAYVENINGQIICYASTTEFNIAKRLHSTTDVMAIVNIARILADRLKQIGVIRVNWVYRSDRTTEKIGEFEGILRNNGIILAEEAVRVLQGPSQTLLPKRPKRVMPGRATAASKKRGTIYRKNDKKK